jgi:hypothetical protein
MPRDSQNPIIAERPKSAVPAGTIVKSMDHPNVWGVIGEAKITHLDMTGKPVVSYQVSWSRPAPPAIGAAPQRPTVMDVLGLDLFTALEMEYDLIYFLDPSKDHSYLYDE